MEQIVRPFQSVSVTRTKKLSTTAATTTPTDAHICWGSAGELPEAVQQDDDFDGINFRVEECDDFFQEKTDPARDTENVRVENPDDSSQYVVDQRIMAITFSKKTKKKLFTNFQTDTTAFPSIDPFAGSPFGDKPLTKDSCSARFFFNR